MSKPKKPILKFTVQMSKWRCGGVEYSVKDDDKPLIRSKNHRGKGESALLNDEGYMCCLGFACRAAGYKGSLKDEAEPADLKYALPGLSFWEESFDGEKKLMGSAFSTGAMQINDATGTSVEVKKRKLIELGKEHGIVVRFSK